MESDAKEPKRYRFAKYIGDKVIVVFLIALFTTFIAPPLVEKINRSAPTCSSPTGLQLAQIGPRLVDQTASVSVDYTAFSRQLGDEVNGFPPTAAFDANPRTLWAVKRANRTKMQQVNQPIVTLNLDLSKTPIDVELVCLINGNPFDTPSFQRVDKVRKYRASTSCHRGDIAELAEQTTAATEIQQPIAGRCAQMTMFRLEVVDVFKGSEISNREGTGKEPPTNNIAVGEVVIYVSDPTYEFDFFTWVGRRLYRLGLYS